MAEKSESSSEAAQPAKTDDLLAQLAGEEVDRLLAEAEVERAPEQEGEPGKVDEEEAAAITSMLEESAQKELEAVQAAATAKAEAAVETPAALAEVEESKAEVVNSPAAVAPAGGSTEQAAQAPAEAPEELSAQLDQLFAALTTEKKEQAEAAATVQEAQAREAVEEKKAQSAPAGDEGAVASEEKAALSDGSEKAGEILDERIAWWARPLEWINAPFGFLSENVKEKLGWVGVQTLIFAALILAYVWWKKGK